MTTRHLLLVLSCIAIPASADAPIKLAKLAPGSKVTVSGKISHAEVLGRTNAELHIDILEAKLK